MKKCLKCKTENPAFANYCRKCGHRFPEHTKPDNSHMCHIENFSIKKQSNGKFLVEWNAVNADKVTINGRDVTRKNKFIATVKGCETILLRADNDTSFDVKEANVVYDSQIIFIDKIVEKKVASGINVFAIVFLVLFVLLTALLIHYAYQLEDRYYSGDRYLSNVFGYKQYLLVNGSNEERNVIVPAKGASLMYNVKTNASEYVVLDLPNWCTLEKRDSCFIITVAENSKSPKVADIRVKAEDMEVKINLTQGGQKITGQIKDVTIEHNVYEDGVKGMKIHLKFLVQNMKGIKGQCTAYMYYEDGTPLKDTNGSYRTTDGQCSFGKDFTPPYDETTFTDFVIFVPLKELEADKGEHNMKFLCTIRKKSSDSSTSIARSEYYSFTLRK